MGYNTEFCGQFMTTNPVDEETYKLLVGLASTRRMARNVGPEYGIEGEFYVEGSGVDGQGREPNIIDYNRPPITQPNFWCKWLMQEDHQTIMWNGMEKFYNYVEWLQYIVRKVLSPRGYLLNGTVYWRGYDFRDNGRITVVNNRVSAKRFK